MNTFLLAGSIFLSSVTYNLNEIYLIPGGDNIVFDLKTDGLIITGAYDFIMDGKRYNPLSNQDIKVGDMIYSINGINIASIDDFKSEIENSITNHETLHMGLKRGNISISRPLKYAYEDGKLKTGLYVRSNIYGIGTLSFIDPKNNLYGALGHEVYDEDIKGIPKVNSGEIYLEDVKKINKGENNHPGVKESNVSFENSIGSIACNSIYGIFGDYQGNKLRNPLKMGLKSEIKTGIAYIQSTISSNLVERFKIRITSLRPQDNNQTKGICFEVIDKRLLDAAGGIYSGMSGSPIIQDNKIIGVVTHVINSNIKQGYGLYMENMYYQALNNLTIR